MAVIIRNPRIDYTISHRERAKRAARGLGWGTWQTRGLRPPHSGATLGERCIRCRELFPLGTDLLDRYGRCRLCVNECIDADPEERERWHRRNLRIIR